MIYFKDGFSLTSLNNVYIRGLSAALCLEEMQPKIDNPCLCHKKLKSQGDIGIINVQEVLERYLGVSFYLE